MSSRLRRFSRPSPARERDIAGPEDDGPAAVGAARASRQSSCALGGAEAAGPLDSGNARQEQPQEVSPSGIGMNSRRTRQRTERQQQRRGEESQSEPRREVCKKSARGRTQDEQSTDQPKTEREKQQKREVEDHIKLICDQFEDSWLRIEEFEARRSPLLRTDVTSSRYNFLCRELIRQYSKAIDEENSAIQTQSQAILRSERRGFEAPEASTTEQRHSSFPRIVGHSTASLGRMGQRYSTQSAAAARAEPLQHRHAASISDSGGEWAGFTSNDVRPAQFAAWPSQHTYPTSQNRGPVPRPEHQRAPIPSTNDPRVRAAAVSELRSILGQRGHRASSSSLISGDREAAPAQLHQDIFGGVSDWSLVAQGLAAGRGVAAPVGSQWTAQGIQSSTYVRRYREENTVGRRASQSNPHPMPGVQPSAVTTSHGLSAQASIRTTGTGATGVGLSRGSITGPELPVLSTIPPMPIFRSDREHGPGDDGCGSDARRNAFPHRGIAALTITTGIPQDAESARAPGWSQDMDRFENRCRIQDGSDRSHSDERR